MTPQEIAREAAEAFAAAGTQSRYGHEWDWVFLGGEPAFEPDQMDSYDAQATVARLREKLSAAVLAAIERALASAPVPGGLGEERLAEIRRCVREDSITIGRGRPAVLSRKEVARLAEDLLAHVEHLTRALYDCGADGSSAVWSAGYEAGRRAAEEEVRRAWAAGFGVGASAPLGADVRAADAELAHWGDAGHESAWHVRLAVLAAPAARPPQEG